MTNSDTRLILMIQAEVGQYRMVQKDHKHH